jgi:hypothetical protein
MMPDGSLVAVAVEGGHRGTNVAVTDQGAAARYVSDHGAELTDEAAAAIWRVARDWGLEDRPHDLRLGSDRPRLAPRTPQVRTSAVPLPDIGWAIAVVANASRDAAIAALKAARRRAKGDFHEAVARGMERVFGVAALTRKGRLAGISAKPHTFEWLAKMASGHLLTLDTALPDAGSIGAVVVRNLDVRRAQHERLTQVIAYDEAEAWPSEMIEQLRLAEAEIVQGRALDKSLASLLADLR